MSRFAPKRLLYPLLAAALALATPELLAQGRRRVIEEPRWMKLRISEVSTGVYGEGRFDDTTFGDADNSITHSRIFIGPSLGFNAVGSIYHPNLMRFHVNTEGSYGWGTETVENRGTKISRSEMNYLGRFGFSADFLANKPYNGNAFVNYDHSFRDFDFFNRVTIDSFRYGSRVNYHDDAWSFQANYLHQEEEGSGLIGSTISEDDTIGLQASNNRDRGVTTFNYVYNQYSRTDFGLAGVGEDHSVTLSDAERFGGRDQFRLNSGVSYYRRSAFTDANDEVRGNASLSWDHRPTLSSYYDLDYSHYNGANLTSDNFSGQARLRHQLYESLTSTLIGQGVNYTVGGPAASGHSQRFGVGLTEDYTKRIGTEHRVRVSNSFMIEHVDQQSINIVENERHSFAEDLGAGPDRFFLNVANVIQTTIQVTDVEDSQPGFILGIDYDVLTLGSRTVIQRIPGSRIPSGGVVLVDYETQPQSAGSYQSFTEVFSIRFDLWKNLVGLYARMSTYGNNAASELFARELTSYTFGSDVNWRWLRAGIEYEIYNSDESDYTSLRLFQSASFRPDDQSSLGLELSESWTDYGDGGREENYRFISRYNRGFSHRLRATIEGGIHLRMGRDRDQTLATIRPGVDYTIGKTSIRAGYDYEYQLFLDREERNKHFLFVRLKRVF